MVRRRRWDIIIELLYITRDPVKIEELERRVDLSYKFLTKYLDGITNAGLIILGKDSCYRITQKGRDILDKIKLVEEEKLEVEDERKKLEEMLIP